MTNTIKDGGPAYPVPNLEHDLDFNGMSLRDYFASNVRNDGIAFPDFNTAASWVGVPAPDENNYTEMLEFSFKLKAKINYMQADAMIAARGAAK